MKVSLACHLLTQKGYYYYRKAKQEDLVKSLVASGDGGRHTIKCGRVYD